MDGWALGSVEPGDPRWAPVGDHAVDGQASCLHRHRDDMGWPMAAALSTRSLPHYGSTSATTRTCKRPKTSLSPWWWYTLPTGLITPCVAPTLVAQIQLGTPHGWPVGQHCTYYPTTPTGRLQTLAYLSILPHITQPEHPTRHHRREWPPGIRFRY